MSTGGTACRFAPLLQCFPCLFSSIQFLPKWCPLPKNPWCYHVVSKQRPIFRWLLWLVFVHYSEAGGCALVWSRVVSHLGTLISSLGTWRFSDNKGEHRLHLHAFLPTGSFYLINSGLKHWILLTVADCRKCADSSLASVNHQVWKSKHQVTHCSIHALLPYRVETRIHCHHHFPSLTRCRSKSLLLNRATVFTATPFIRKVWIVLSIHLF